MACVVILMFGLLAGSQSQPHSTSHFSTTGGDLAGQASQRLGRDQEWMRTRRAPETQEISSGDSYRQREDYLKASSKESPQHILVIDTGTPVDVGVSRPSPLYLGPPAAVLTLTYSPSGQVTLEETKPRTSSHGVQASAPRLSQASQAGSISSGTNDGSDYVALRPPYSGAVNFFKTAFKPSPQLPDIDSSPPPHDFFPLDFTYQDGRVINSLPPYNLEDINQGSDRSKPFKPSLPYPGRPTAHFDLTYNSTGHLEHFTIEEGRPILENSHSKPVVTPAPHSNSTESKPVSTPSPFVNTTKDKPATSPLPHVESKPVTLPIKVSTSTSKPAGNTSSLLEDVEHLGNTTPAIEE